ncbi:MAG TPA: peptidase S10 [Crenalkalicoccus sp.]|nr:peptidase S10 [Crenalkalicoccus sp.]
MTPTKPAFLRAAWLAGFAAAVVSGAVVAQTPPPAAPAGPAEAQAARPAGPRSDTEAEAAERRTGAPGAENARRLPPDATTRHALDLPGRTLHFAATAGSFRLTDAQGAPQADLAYIDYQLELPEPRTRAVTFVVNGGPGAASAWLQLGALGPWRLPLAGAAALPSAPPDLVPNAETWLDFTDLVFIDPAGTGYSGFPRPGDEARRRLWSVEGDIRSLAEVVRRWLEKNGRLVSPKFLVGESYGGFRGPRLARALQTDQGIGIGGLVLISPVLDFGGRSAAFDPLSWATRLPTMAAAARAASGTAATSAELAEAERYAAGEYVADLLRGERDAEAIARASERVAALTGLDPALVQRRHGRVEVGEFLRELGRRDGRVASAYDATVTGPDPFPFAVVSRHPDPVLDALIAPLTSAMLDLYGRRLGWHPEGRRYELLNRATSREWDWGRADSPPESVGSLRTALALDTRLRVLVAHGLFDLVTPYFGTKLLLAQVPERGGGDRIRLVTYPGGHMFYAVDASRAALRDEARAMIGSR